MADTDPSWHTLILGAERALAPPATGGTVLFGVGPPHGGRRLEPRSRSLLDQLAPAVSAVRWCHQVHGSELVTVAAGTAPGACCVGPGDGLLTSQPGVGLLVWTADCVPLLMIGERAVAAIHVGWRGAAAGIVGAAVAAFRRDHQDPPHRLRAFLGPAVSAASYRVGPEVIDALRGQGVPEQCWRHGDRVDLRRLVAAQLGGLGVEPVTVVGGCTATTPELASYRRDGATAGRQWSCVFRSL